MSLVKAQRLTRKKIKEEQSVDRERRLFTLTCALWCQEIYPSKNLEIFLLLNYEQVHQIFQEDLASFIAWGVYTNYIGTNEIIYV